MSYNTREHQIVEDIAKVLRKHKVAICARANGEYGDVFFQYAPDKDKKHITTNIELGRCHVTAYDLTGEQ